MIDLEKKEIDLKFEVKGRFACFTRPEFKVDRVSYDFITPSSAISILKCIYWHPGIIYKIKKISVMNEIKFYNHTKKEYFKNQNKGKSNLNDLAVNLRHNRILENVHYVIDASYYFDEKEEDIFYKFKGEKKFLNDNNKDVKHLNIFRRRIEPKKEVYYYKPYLGCKEYSCSEVKFLNFDGETINEFENKSPIDLTRNFGMMFYDWNYKKVIEELKKKDKDKDTLVQRWFLADMKDGIVEINKLYGEFE